MAAARTKAAEITMVDWVIESLPIPRIEYSRAEQWPLAGPGAGLEVCLMNRLSAIEPGRLPGFGRVLAATAAGLDPPKGAGQWPRTETCYKFRSGGLYFPPG